MIESKAGLAERNKALTIAKFLRIEGEHVLSQRAWNLVADAELHIATVETTHELDLAGNWLRAHRVWP